MPGLVPGIFFGLSKGLKPLVSAVLFGIPAAARRQHSVIRNSRRGVEVLA